MLFALISQMSGFSIQPLLQTILIGVRNLGTCRAIAFVGIYSLSTYNLSTMLLISGFLLTLGRNVVLALGRWFAAVMVDACIGATLAFLISRQVLRRWVVQQVDQTRQFQSIGRAIAQQEQKSVLITRRSPVFPFSLLNHMLGITQSSLKADDIGFLDMIFGAAIATAMTG